MCMKYLNATLSCYKSVVMVDNSVTSLNWPFDKISANINEDGNFFIEDFFVVTQINLLGTQKEDKKQYSTLEKRENLEVKIRLTKCDKDENNQRYIDLDCFVIDFNNEENKKNIHTACFDYFNYKRITTVHSIELPLGTGTYVIKVIVKEASQKKETVQSMNYLYVSDESPRC